MPKDDLRQPLLAGNQTPDAKLDVKADISVDEKKSGGMFVNHFAYQKETQKPLELTHAESKSLTRNEAFVTNTSFGRVSFEGAERNAFGKLVGDEKITASERLKKVDEQLFRLFPGLTDNSPKLPGLRDAAIEFMADFHKDGYITKETSRFKAMLDSSFIAAYDHAKTPKAEKLLSIVDEQKRGYYIRRQGNGLQLIIENTYTYGSTENPDSTVDASTRFTVTAQFDEDGNRIDNLITREYTAHTPLGLEELKFLDSNGIKLAPDPYLSARRKAQDKLVDPTSDDENRMNAALMSDTLDAQARLIAKYYTNIIQSLVELEKLTPEIDRSELITHYQKKLAQIINNSNQHGLRYEFYNDQKHDISQRDQIRNALGKPGLSPKAYLQLASAKSEDLYYNELGQKIKSKNALISDTNAFLSSLNKAELADDAKKVVEHFDLHFSKSIDEVKNENLMKELPKNPKKNNQRGIEYKTVKELVRSCADSRQAESNEMVGQVRNDAFDFAHSELKKQEKSGLDNAKKILLQYMNLMKAGADLNIALTQTQIYIELANKERDKVLISTHFSHLDSSDFTEFERHYNKVRTNFDLYPELGVLRDMLHEYSEESLTWSNEKRLQKITVLHKHIETNNSVTHFYSYPAQQMMKKLAKKVADEQEFVSVVLPTLQGKPQAQKIDIPKPKVSNITRFISYMQTRPISSTIMLDLIAIAVIATLVLFAWPAIAAAVGASVPAFLTTALSSTFQGISIVAAGYIAAGASFMLSGIVSYFSTKKTPTVEVRFDSEKDKATSNVGIAHANWGSETYMPKHAKAQIFINAFLQGKIKPNNPESKILNDIFVDRHSKDSIEIREFIATNNDLFEQVKQYTAIAALRKSLTGNTEKNTAPATIPSDKASAKALSKVGLLGDRGARAAASREDQPSPVDPDEQRTEETTPRPGGRTNSGK